MLNQHVAYTAAAAYRPLYCRLWATAIVALALLAGGPRANAQLNTLYPFGGYPDGANPNAGVIQDNYGFLWGTTYSGGAHGYGCVYTVNPSSGAEAVMYSFSGSASGGPDGANPEAPLLLATDGNFYGTTVNGGAYGYGCVYQITQTGQETVIYSFSGPANGDGRYPNAGLVEGTDGNLYGSTYQGGWSDLGTAYEIEPGVGEVYVYSFSGTDGVGPLGGLVEGTDGALYGATAYGGANGDGAFFRLYLGGGLYTLYSFGGGADGIEPTGPLTQGADGAFYGTTQQGGQWGDGTVFRVTSVGAEEPFYSFSGGPGDGSDPEGGVALASNGMFYGGTYQGGADGYGTLFMLTPDGAESLLYSFTYGTDGAHSIGTLIQGRDGNLYGATPFGGSGADAGTVFGFTAPPAILSLAPASTVAGGPGFTLTVNGGTFISGAVVNWDGSALTTTFVSATQLQATVPAGDIASPGAATVTVTQNSQTSNAAAFTIANPVPVLKSISPGSADAGGAGFTLTVKGSSFVNGSAVEWNGSPLPTTYISSAQLKAAVPAADIAGVGKATVTVFSPAPGGGTSAAKTFNILVTTLKLTGASLTRNGDGSYTAVLTIKNEGFNAAGSAAVKKSTLGGKATTSTLPASLGSIAPGATANVTLSYPASAGTSGSKVKLTASGSFTGGTFSGGITVKLP